MAIESAGWAGGDEGGWTGDTPRMLPVNQPTGHNYSPANPYELRVPSYPGEKCCGVWELHAPHYWDLATGDPKYCLGLGSMETINEH